MYLVRRPNLIKWMQILIESLTFEVCCDHDDHLYLSSACIIFTLR